MEAKVIRVEHYIPEVVIKENDHKSFRKYLEDGFFVFKVADGCYTLRKKFKILVTIEYDGKQRVVNLRYDFKQHYGNMDVKKAIERFKNDLKSGKKRLEVDSTGYCSIIGT